MCFQEFERQGVGNPAHIGCLGDVAVEIDVVESRFKVAPSGGSHGKFLFVEYGGKLQAWNAVGGAHLHHAIHLAHRTAAVEVDVHPFRGGAQQFLAVFPYHAVVPEGEQAVDAGGPGFNIDLFVLLRHFVQADMQAVQHPGGAGSVEGGYVHAQLFGLYLRHVIEQVAQRFHEQAAFVVGVVVENLYLFSVLRNLHDLSLLLFFLKWHILPVQSIR